MLSLAVSSKSFEIRLPLLYSDMQSLVGFPLIPKYVITNDRNGYSTLNCFRARTSFRKMRETNTDRPIVSAAVMFKRKSSRKSSL